VSAAGMGEPPRDRSAMSHARRAYSLAPGCCSRSASIVRGCALTVWAVALTSTTLLGAENGCREATDAAEVVRGFVHVVDGTGGLGKLPEHQAPRSVRQTPSRYPIPDTRKSSRS
jgi:hypothetical protein